MDVRRPRPGDPLPPRVRARRDQRQFHQRGSDGGIAIRTYERGVEDETLACGTGSVAGALVAAHTLEPDLAGARAHAQRRAPDGALRAGRRPVSRHSPGGLRAAHLRGPSVRRGLALRGRVQPVDIGTSSTSRSAPTWATNSANCRRGVEALAADGARADPRPSRVYRTAPVDYTDQDWFVNRVIKVETDLDPLALLERLQAVQQALGRTAPAVRFGPRVLDLDILLYDRLVFDDPRLSIPHPRMHARRFVLTPLCDIDPERGAPGPGQDRRGDAVGAGRSGAGGRGIRCSRLIAFALIAYVAYRLARRWISGRTRSTAGERHGARPHRRCHGQGPAVRGLFPPAGRGGADGTRGRELLFCSRECRDRFITAKSNTGE